MKLRLTPLNIISSILLVSIAYLFVFPDEAGFRKLGSIPLIIMFVFCFFIDLIFRRLIPDLKRIWMFEVLFVILAGCMLVVIQSL